MPYSMLGAALQLLPRGVHVLPVLRGDGAFLLIAVDRLGRALRDPTWATLEQLPAVTEELQAILPPEQGSDGVIDLAEQRRRRA